jgi:hypothetical protein
MLVKADIPRGPDVPTPSPRNVNHHVGQAKILCRKNL